MATTARPRPKSSDFDDAPARDARIFLIDGSSLAYRSFFALPQEIATSDGRPTNALLGFSNMLLKLVSDYDPETVIVAWDLPGKTFRSDMFADYKGQRPQMPDLLSEQWPHFRPLVEAFGFTNIAHEKYEADDVIGTLAAQSAERGVKTCIVTYDRDAMQLVSDKVVVMMTTKGVSEVAVYTPERVSARWEVTPAQIPDLIALKGDTSDNIPGIPGIGEKTAATLLREYGSIEKLIANADKVSGTKRRENIKEFADQSIMSKELATIVCDLPLDIDIDKVHAEPVDRSRLGELFQAWEFRALTRRIAELELGEPAGDTPPRVATGTSTSVGETVPARMVSVHELQQVLAGEAHASALVVQPDPDNGEAVLAAVAIEPGGSDEQRWVAVLRGSAATIAESLAGSRIATFDFKALPAPFLTGDIALTDDAVISTYLLQPGRRIFLLGEIAAEFGVATNLDFDCDNPALRETASHASLLPRVIERQHEQLTQTGMIDLYRDVELPLVTVLVEVEKCGVKIDTYRMGEITHKVTEQVDELRDRAFELAGEEFNLGSPSQLSVILFEKLGLPAQRKGKTGYSTDARVLRDLRDMHPIVPIIEQYRELAKLKNTYLDSLPDLVNPKSGRVHTTFNQVAAATGRLSSQNPNLQNIPIRTAIGREIRSAFVPDEGSRFIACDYSQVELRLLAHVSQEPKLIETFERGEDVHLATAAEVAGVDPAEVTREQRNAAKAVNFGIIYGISSFGLSSQLQISRDEAQVYIDRYLGRYPHVSDFMERTIEVAKRDGYVTTIFGRRRPIPELKSRSYQTRQLGERLAVNTVLQGSAADIIKIAMIRTQQRLHAEGIPARIVLQIHDELLLEAPEEHVKTVSQVVRDEMVGAFEMTPALVVDVGVGSTWLDAK